MVLCTSNNNAPHLKLISDLVKNPNVSDTELHENTNTALET